MVPEAGLEPARLTATDFLTTSSFDAITQPCLDRSLTYNNVRGLDCVFTIESLGLNLERFFLSTYLFRYFPYSLYTFLIVCRSIAALSFDWRFSRYRSHRLGSALAYFLCDIRRIVYLPHTHEAFAEFEKIHPMKPCFGGFSKLLLDKPLLEIYLRDILVLHCFTVFRLHCYANSGYLLLSRSLTTNAFFGDAQFVFTSPDVVSVELSLLCLPIPPLGHLNCIKNVYCSNCL